MDDNGYEREVIEHSNLTHRRKAYKYIYLKNRDQYPLPFSKYVVHHIDGNKKNNKIDNLQILTQEEHEELHGINDSFPENRRLDEYAQNQIPIVYVDELPKREIVYTKESLDNTLGKNIEYPGSKSRPKKHIISENGFSITVIIIALLITVILAYYVSNNPYPDQNTLLGKSWLKDNPIGYGPIVKNPSQAHTYSETDLRDHKKYLGFYNDLQLCSSARNVWSYEFDTMRGYSFYLIGKETKEVTLKSYPEDQMGIRVYFDTIPVDWSDCDEKDNCKTISPNDAKLIKVEFIVKDGKVEKSKEAECQ